MSCLFLFAVVQSETGVRGSSVRIFKMKWIFLYYLQWGVRVNSKKLDNAMFLMYFKSKIIIKLQDSLNKLT